MKDYTFVISPDTFGDNPGPVGNENVARFNGGNFSGDEVCFGSD